MAAGPDGALAQLALFQPREKLRSADQTQGLGMSSSTANTIGLQALTWLASVALALVVSIVLCWPTWPGFMSFDSLFALQESTTGITSGIWPPMQAYLFYLSRTAGLGVVGYFFGQTFLLFLSCFVIIGLYSTRVSHYLAYCLVFCALFLLFPTMWGTVGVIWKDVTTASFACAGVACWLLAVRSRSFLLVALAGLAFFFSLALRFNAVPLVFFLMIGLAIFPFGKRSRKLDRAISAAIVVSFTVLAALSAIYRLPDLAPLPADKGFSGIQLFDLVGISVCSGQVYAPIGDANGNAITLDQLTQMYEPRHANLTLQPREGIPGELLVDGPQGISARWMSTVPQQLGCYFDHRMKVFAYLMGFNDGPTFYPTHGGIDENRFGVSLTRPVAAQVWVGEIVAGADQAFRRIFWLYGVATILFAAWGVRNRFNNLAIVGLWLGAILYPAALFFVSPAGDARYTFPSSVFCCLLIVLCADGLRRRDDRPEPMSSRI